MTDQPCFCAVHVTVPCARNSRTHSADQVRQIAASIRRSGFTSPVLMIVGDNTIIAGHGWCAVPRLTSLPDAQRRAYIVADNGRLAATKGRSRCPEITDPSRRGGLVGVMCRTCLLLRADFFAFRFVSDFRRRQPIATVQEIFTDGSSETKWPPRRNEMPSRNARENRRRGRAGICAIPPVKKPSGGQAWPAAKKPSRDGTRSGPARSPGIGRLPPDVPVP